MDIQLLIPLILPLLLGAVLDCLLGDPQWLPHPVVGFGRSIAFLEHRLNRGVRRRLKGGVMSLSLIAATYALTRLLVEACYVANMWIGVAVSALLVFFCLAGKTLAVEVRMVFSAVGRSTEEGRAQVARIVGRDTGSLSAREVRAAALETLAENLSDGVIAPLFWFLLLGVPGMMAYKMVNTLDSMIGYRNERYGEFGCVAARIDDVANYIPARLTALLMAIVSGVPRRVLGFVRRYGRQHSSPNSGFPESALAGILDCRFGGTHSYFGQPVYKPFIGTNDRELDDDDAVRAIGVNRRSELLMLLIVAVLQLLRAYLA